MNDENLLFIFYSCWVLPRNTQYIQIAKRKQEYDKASNLNEMNIQHLINSD